MQYLGGKSRIAGQIASIILNSTANRNVYIEPFVGAGSVAAELVPHFETARLSDASPDLIELWRGLQDGWQPPETVSETEYHDQRNATVSPLRGFVGYGCSFGGKWFGGYARDPERGRNFARTAGNLLAKRTELVKSATFDCLDYRNVLIPEGAVVYCDPPYRGTVKYGRLADFDSDSFWKRAASWSAHCDVFVSEYSAPNGWVSVWNATPRVTMRVDSKSPRPTEHLWVYRPYTIRDACGFWNAA